MKYKVAERTDKGVRDVNQDSIIVFANEYQHLFVAVADGMGGHVGGQIASKFAVKALKEYFKEKDFSLNVDKEIKSDLIRSIKFIIREFKRMGEEQPKFKDMGTTLNFNMFINNNIWTVNVGDSRSTKVDHTGYNQISEDHNLAALAKKDKRFEAFAKDANLLTSSLGPSKETSVDIFKTKITESGYLIVTSDGIHQFVSEDFVVKTMLNEDIKLGKKADIIVKEAFDNRTHDNVSLVVVSYEI